MWVLINKKTMADDFGLDDADNVGNDAMDIDIGDDPDFQEGCQTTRGGELRVGRKRNWLTGYCRVPCPNGEQRHPQTGVCTTLDDLREEGVHLGRQFEYVPVERSIVDRSAPDKRDRWAPLVNPALGDANLPNNNYCPAGTRLNLGTKKCKKVPQCNRWEAVNPRTGRCATREYLKRQVTEQQPHGPFLYEGEDSIEHANEKWYPDNPTMINNRQGLDVMQDFIRDSGLTVADIRTMRGVEEAGRIHGIQDDGQVGGPNVDLIGVYSPPQRKKCENSTFTRFLVSDFYACGFRKVEIIDNGDNEHIDNFIVNIGNDQDFIFIKKNMATFDMLKQLLKVTQRCQQNRKFVVVHDVGLWRILIRYVPYAGGSLEDYYDHVDGVHFDPQDQHLADYLDAYAADIMSVSVHAFDDETLV